MTKKKLTILSLAVVALIALPLSAVEIKEAPSHEAVLGTSVITLALNTENSKQTVKKPVTTVAKKKPVAKKKTVRKKERLITTPTLYTEANAPSSPRRR
jgi:hypothetical protein